MSHERNYVPDPTSTVASSGCSGGSLLSGGSTPVCAGFEGQYYLDLSTGDIYQYQSGSWTLVVNGGGGGTGATYAGNGSPEGVQTGDPGNTYWDVTNSVFYVKNTGTGTNTGWAAVVG